MDFIVGKQSASNLCNDKNVLSSEEYWIDADQIYIEKKDITFFIVK